MTPSLSSGGRISKMSMQRTTNKLEPKEELATCAPNRRSR